MSLSSEAISLDTLSEARLRRLDLDLFSYDTFKDIYRNNPKAFVLDCFDWSGSDRPTAYQLECLQALVAKRRLAVRGPHGLGKTTLAAWVVLWFALTRDGEDWKIVTTASSWRQLTKFLWPEVHKWARNARWEMIGRSIFMERRELLDLTLKLDTGVAFAAASDQPGTIEGAHADHMLYIFDEAKHVPDETFDAAEGAFSGAGADTSREAFALAISTPGDPAGRFYDIHRRRPGFDDWSVRHVTLQEAIASERISDDWASHRREQWGEDSAIYHNRVLGEFASSDESNVIPLAWVEQAQLRHEGYLGTVRNGTSLTALGVDVAREGSDKTIRASRVRQGITAIAETRREDTMETAGRVKGQIEQQGGIAVVDIIGPGAGVFDRIKEQHVPCIAYNGAMAAAQKRNKKDKPITDASGELGFQNMRSASWWHLRELLDPKGDDPIALPPEDRLVEELTTPHWSVTSNGRIKVESKDDVKRRLGRSTDYADAVIMAFALDMLRIIHYGVPSVIGKKRRSMWRR